MKVLPEGGMSAVKRAGFIGLGKSNIGVFNYLKDNYKNIKFTLRSSDIPKNSLSDFERIMLGNNEFSNIDEDILFLSPSVRRDKKELAEAEARGVILSSDADLFLNCTDSDIYAVTGSDGKSTTTTVASLLLSSGYDFALPCGNIGEPLTPHLCDKKGGAYAVELSSFQLMYSKPKTKRCVITNITRNHLDWHISFDEYIEAKANILENAEERIFNFDCVISGTLMKEYPVFAVFSLNKSEAELKRLVKAELYITERDGAVFVSGDKLLKTEDIRLCGRHNTANFMAAIALSYGKCTKDDILRIGKSFCGLPHRYEHFLTHGGIKFIDSSIDSSPARTVSTLKIAEGNIIIILGGRSKKLDYRELLSAMDKKIKLAVLTGESGKEIEAVFREYNSYSSRQIPFASASGFFSAVDIAVSNAAPGDTVLLSPASASFDSFKNFEERGNAFKDYIKERMLSSNQP